MPAHGIILSTVNISNTLRGNGSRIISRGRSITPIAANPANIACLAFPVAFIAATTALETYQPGYNRVANTISELVWGPVGWVENILFLAFAVTLAMFALRMRAAFTPLAVAAIGFVIIAIFPTGAPGARPTMISLIHQYTAQGIALALPVACFCVAQKLKPSAEHRFIVTCNTTAGVIGILLNLAGFLAVYGETEWVGAAERLVMLNGLIWLQIISIFVWILTRKSPIPCCSNIGRLPTFAALVTRPELHPVRVKATSADIVLRNWQ